jgi:uncharacterized cupin superfamily protein
VKKVNLGSLEFVYEAGRPEGHDIGMAQFGPSIDAVMLGATVYELPPGQRSGPYHYEYGNEEWAIVLEGRPAVRHPEGEDELGPMDVVCFPEGPAGAHTLRNPTDETVRVLMLSTVNDPSLGVYPDSNKIYVSPGPVPGEDHVLLRRESRVGYWDGEP